MGNEERMLVLMMSMIVLPSGEYGERIRRMMVQDSAVLERVAS